MFVLCYSLLSSISDMTAPQVGPRNAAGSDPPVRPGTAEMARAAGNQAPLPGLRAWDRLFSLV